MALTLEEVRHVAGFARLSLSAEEEQAFTRELSRVLDAMEELAALDTTGVEPTAWTMPDESTVREDVVRPSLGAERAVERAPESIGTHFAVPKVLE